jgi:hypothetical protein
MPLAFHMYTMCIKISMLIRSDPRIHACILVSNSHFEAIEPKFCNNLASFVLVYFWRRRNGSHMRSCQKHQKSSLASCC